MFIIYCMYCCTLYERPRLLYSVLYNHNQAWATCHLSLTWRRSLSEPDVIVFHLGGALEKEWGGVEMEVKGPIQRGVDRRSSTRLHAARNELSELTPW